METPAPPPPKPTFKVGDVFPTFAKVKERIELYSTQNHVPMSISDSRTLKSAVSKSRLAKEISEEKVKLLHYCEVKYACIHGGRKHTNRGTGKRKTSTFKKNCPCFVSFRVDDRGENLIVTNVNMEHANHEVNEQLYQFYPKVRKLNEDDKSYAERMLAMKVNKKLLLHELKNDTGKRVSLRDLTNIAVAAKRRHSTRNDLNACVDLLRNVYHCNVDICTSTDNEFCGIFVQDADMRETFAAFPEILFAILSTQLTNFWNCYFRFMSLLVRILMALRRLQVWDCC